MTARVFSALRFGLPTLVFLSLGACAPPIYFAKATHGTVVDAETKQPIEGAVIVANWDLLDRLSGEGSHGRRYMQITEVTTNKDGNFVVPCWGPRLRPCLAELDTRDPYMVVFKSNYEPRGLLNWYKSNAWVRVSEWDGRTIELPPFRGTTKERVEKLEWMVGNVDRGPPLNALYRELLNEREALGPTGKRLFIRAEDLTKERR